MKERIEWLDIAKGLGIFLVVLGHNSIPFVVFIWIYSFHMPLFFYLSGFLFSADKYNSTWEFVKRKAQTLLLPYFSFFVLIYTYWLVVIQKAWLDPIGIFEPITNLFYGSTHLLTVFTPLWFLPALFIVEVLFYLLYKNTKNWLIYSSILVAVVGYLISIWFKGGLIWSIDTAMVAILFFMFGFNTKNLMSKNLVSLKNIILCALILVFFGINLWFFKINGTVDLLNNQYHNFIWFVLSATGGIGGLVLVSLLMGKTKNKIMDIIIFAGRNSLIILAFHPIGILIVKTIVKSFSNSLNIILRDEGSLLFGIIYSLMSILLVTPLIYVLNKYLPFIRGKRINPSPVKQLP